MILAGLTVILKGTTIGFCEMVDFHTSKYRDSQLNYILRQLQCTKRDIHRIYRQAETISEKI